MSRLPRPGAAVLAVDVGGTTIKGARVDGDGRALELATVPTGTGTSAVAAVVAVCQRLQTPECTGATLAVAGNVDVEAGVVRYAANIGWRALPLREIVSQQLALPVTLIHDVQAACLAEQAVGRGRSATDMLFVGIGTGIAAGIVSSGRLLAGGSNSAGELGHVVVHPDGPPCGCGQRGCLEVFASASGIVRRFRELGGDPHLTAADIVRSPTAQARQTWREATSALARGLAAATVLVDPSVVVIGGGVSQAGSALLDPVRAALGRLLPWRSVPALHLSPLGDRGGQTGAAIAAWHAAGYPSIAQRWPVAATELVEQT